MTLTPSATLEHLRLAVELSGCDAEVVLPSNHHVVANGHRLHCLDWGTRRPAADPLPARRRADRPHLGRGLPRHAPRLPLPGARPARPRRQRVVAGARLRARRRTRATSAASSTPSASTARSWWDSRWAGSTRSSSPRRSRSASRRWHWSTSAPASASRRAAHRRLRARNRRDRLHRGLRRPGDGLQSAPRPPPADGQRPQQPAPDAEREMGPQERYPLPRPGRHRRGGQTDRSLLGSLPRPRLPDPGGARRRAATSCPATPPSPSPRPAGRPLRRDPRCRPHRPGRQPPRPGGGVADVPRLTRLKTDNPQRLQIVAIIERRRLLTPTA